MHPTGDGAGGGIGISNKIKKLRERQTHAILPCQASQTTLLQEMIRRKQVAESIFPFKFSFRGLKSKI